VSDLSVVRLLSCVFILLPLNSNPSGAQEPESMDLRGAGMPGSIMSDGMVEALVKRGSYELARSLDMDDVQRDRLTQTMLDRWMPFAREHRPRMAPIVDRMMQAAWDPEMPTVEEAQGWAQQALEMHDLFLMEFQHSNEEVSKILTPQQLEKFNRHRTKINAGMGLFRLELSKMATGQLHDTTWARQRRERTQRRQRRREQSERQRLQDALGLDELTPVSVDAWEDYVAKFAERFGLDDAQKRAAQNILDDVRQRARQYARAHIDELSTLRSELSAAERKQRPALLESRSELIKPLEDLFGELRSRLAELPTEAQRAQAEAKPAAAQAGGS